MSLYIDSIYRGVKIPLSVTDQHASEAIAVMVTFITYISYARRREAEKQWDIEKLMLQDTVH